MCLLWLGSANEIIQNHPRKPGSSPSRLWVPGLGELKLQKASGNCRPRLNLKLSWGQQEDRQQALSRPSPEPAATLTVISVLLTAGQGLGWDLTFRPSRSCAKACGWASGWGNFTECYAACRFLLSVSGLQLPCL